MSDDDPLALLEYAERPRLGDWSLRSALVRYAQPEPRRASAVLELVRRTDGALKPFLRLVERTPSLVLLARRGAAPDDPLDEPLDDPARAAVAILSVAVDLDHLGDVLARWARDITGPRPDDEVDRVARRVFDALAELGVERESPPPRRR